MEKTLSNKLCLKWKLYRLKIEKGVNLLEHVNVFKLALGSTIQKWCQGRGRKQCTVTSNIVSGFFQQLGNNISFQEKYSRPKGHQRITPI